MKKKKKQIHNNTYLSSKFHNSFNSSEVNILSDSDSDKIFKKVYSQGFKKNTVSEFSGMVIESLIGKKDPHKLKKGNYLEKILSKDISEKTKFNFNKEANDEEYRRYSYKFLSDEWELEFDDIESIDNKSFKISKLRYQGASFYGKPDVVYRNKRTNDRIIVEIKHTTNYTDIPIGGWYNLQCQLWSYSWIDKFEDSPNIFLYGDIRKTKNYSNPDDGYKVKISEPSSVNPEWRIRKNGMLNTDNKRINELHNQCKYLFEVIGGEFIV